MDWRDLLLCAASAGFVLGTFVQLAAAWRYQRATRRLQALLAQVRTWIGEDEPDEREK